MSFNSLETSVYEGRPYHLYQFENGSAVWLYTNTEEDAIRSGDTFLSTPISHSDTASTSELNKQVFKVTVPRDNAVARMYSFYPPTSITTVTVWEHHYGASENIVIWTGRITTAEVFGEKAEIRCEPISTSVRRLGLRRVFQRQCPHILYGQERGGCGLDKDNFKTLATVTAVSGLTVSVGSVLVANQFAGGMLAWETALGTQWRFVTSNGTGSVSVNFPFAAPGDTFGRALEAGATVSLYKGCNHTMTDCLDVFNNLDNYGGMPFMPVDNPFNGATIY